MSRVREPAAPRRLVEAAFERRAARAEALASEAQTAAEPLRFAAGLYRVQGRLAATVESAHAGRPLCGRLETDLDSFQHGLAEALRFAAESGPAALAEEARSRGRDEASVARSRLLVFWSGDSEPGEGVALLLRPEVHPQRHQVVHLRDGPRVRREVDGLEVTAAGLAGLDACRRIGLAPKGRELRRVLLEAARASDPTERPLLATQGASEQAPGAVGVRFRPPGGDPRGTAAERTPPRPVDAIGGDPQSSQDLDIGAQQRPRGVAPGLAGI